MVSLWWYKWNCRCRMLYFTYARVNAVQYENPVDHVTFSSYAELHSSVGADHTSRAPGTIWRAQHRHNTSDFMVVAL